MKKLLRAFVMLLVLLGLAFRKDISVSAMTPNDESDFIYYDYDDERVILEWYSGESKKVVVPETLGGKIVYAVEKSAFGGRDDIEEVYLPDTVECFDIDVFYDCANLKAVYLGSPQKDKYLDPARKLGWMLHRCPKLEWIGMSDKANFPLRDSGSRNFEWFYSDLLDHLKYIYIGSSMTEVDESLFYGDGLEYVEIGSENPVYRSVDGVVYSADMKRLLVCGTSYQNADYTIPDGVERIESAGFQFCKNIQKITIPSSVKTIADGFLAEISPTLSVRENSYANAWARNKGYTTEYYGTPLSEAEKINIGSFEAQLSEKSYVYDGTEKKPTVTVDSLTEGSDYTVSYQNNVQAGTAKVVVTGINSYTGTIALEFTVAEQIINGGDSNTGNTNTGNTSTGSQSTENTSTGSQSTGTTNTGSQGTGSASVNEEKSNGNSTKQFPAKGTRLTDKKLKAVYIVMKSGVSAAYAGTTNKSAKSVKIPATVKIDGITYKVTSIAAGAFKNNKKLTNITIGKNVSSIGASAFQSCTALKKITIPAKVKKIGSKAFYNCKKLTAVTIRTKKLTAKTVGSKAFTKTGRTNYKKLKVKAPSSKYAAYKTLLKKKGLSSKSKLTK